jgi:predicted nuclease of predicted toxin-antitoxin system
VHRTLLDEQIPVELAAALASVGAVSVHQLGWSSLKNGELLRLVGSEGFTAFATMDRSLRHQQNLRGRPYCVLLLRARSTRMRDLLPLCPALIAAIEASAPGEFREVGA